MQIKTILNRIQKHRGFVYGDVRLEDQIDGWALTVDLYPHARNRPQCAGCGSRGRSTTCRPQNRSPSLTRPARADTRGGVLLRSASPPLDGPPECDDRLTDQRTNRSVDREFPDPSSRVAVRGCSAGSNA